MNLSRFSTEAGSGTGDVADGAGFRPTDTSRATLASIERDLAEARTAYNTLTQQDIPAFNKATAGKLTPIVLER